MDSHGNWKENPTRDVVVLWVCIALVEIIIKTQRLTALGYLLSAAFGVALFLILVLHPGGAFYGMPITRTLASLVVGGLVAAGLVLLPREAVLAFGAGFTFYPLARWLGRSTPERHGPTLWMVGCAGTPGGTRSTSTTPGG